MTELCNIGAWILCLIVGALLFGDFIKTERRFMEEKENPEAGEGKEERDGSAD